MIIGDKNTFAVQLELEPQHGEAWLFGKFCYWIVGTQVGDYELGVSLRDVLLQMQWIVRDCGKRDGGILCDLTSEKAFDTIHGSMYESDEGHPTDDAQTLETPGRFEVSIPVEVFDHSKVYLIECGGMARMLFRTGSNGVVTSVTIAAGVFDAVIKEVFEYLNSLHDRELGLLGIEQP